MYILHDASFVLLSMCKCGSSYICFRAFLSSRSLSPRGGRNAALGAACVNSHTERTASQKSILSFVATLAIPPMYADTKATLRRCIKTNFQCGPFCCLMEGATHMTCGLDEH
ncbi:unnamed protein product, partial [Ectocarpus fasciculatus]